MSLFISRQRRHAVWGLLLIISSFFLAACSDDAKLVITNCSDQDANQISGEVGITVEKEMKKWKPGERCEFIIPMDNKKYREVAVRGDAGPDFIYNSLDRQRVFKDKGNEVELRFYRPYFININVWDSNNNPMAGVDLYVEGAKIGTTNLEGSWAWSTEQFRYLPGSKVQIEMRLDDQRALADSVILLKEKFDYDTAGRFTNVRSTSNGMPPRSDPFPPVPPAEPKYTVIVQAVDAAGKPLRNVNVSESGRNIGKTNSNGQWIWQKKESEVEIGRTFNFELSKDGKTAAAGPVMLASGNYRYSTRGQLDIVAQPKPIPIEDGGFPPLPPDPAPSTLLAECKALADNNDFDGAIACYQRLSNPGMTGESGAVRDYANAQAQIGIIYLDKIGEFLQAVDAFKNVLAVDRQSYLAHYNLAIVYARTSSYPDCRRECNAVERLLHLIPPRQRTRIELEMIYLRAYSQYRLYQAVSNTEKAKKRQLGLQALSELEDFIARSESQTSFSRQRQDTQGMIDDLEASLPALE